MIWLYVFHLSTCLFLSRSAVSGGNDWGIVGRYLCHDEHIYCYRACRQHTVRLSVLVTENGQSLHKKHESYIYKTKIDSP